MRKRNFIPGILIVCMACNMHVAEGRNGVVFKNGVEYNNYIVDRQAEVLRYLEMFGQSSVISIDSAQRVVALGITKTAEFVDDIAAMSDFKGDSIFRNKSVTVFSYYNRLFKNDYSQLLSLRNKTDPTEEDVLKEQEIIESISRSATEFDKVFLNAQKDFAEKNNFRLEFAEEKKKSTNESNK